MNQKITVHFYHKNGVITVNGTDNTGIAVKAGYGELSGGTVNVKAYNLGVYNNEKFNMISGRITADGTAAVGVYSAPSNLNTNLSGGTVGQKTEEQDFTQTGNSVMNLSQGLTLQSGNKTSSITMILQDLQENTI